MNVIINCVNLLMEQILFIKSLIILVSKSFGTQPIQKSLAAAIFCTRKTKDIKLMKLVADILNSTRSLT